MSAQCKHNSCAGKGWQAFKEAIGKPDPDEFDPPLARSRTSRRGDSDTGQGGAQKADAPRFHFIGSAEFAATDYRLEWLVRRLLVRGQPGIIGGPKKSLKTSLAVDLALSLATGKPFLGFFHVAQPARVALMSGESGEATLKETALRVCSAKGIDLAGAAVWWEFRLPQLSRIDHLAALQDALRECKPEVLILDPSYLCLLAGSENLQASNAMQMGPLFMAVAKTCLDIGCAPLLAHHFKLTRVDPLGEPQLDDLAYAGVQEFARQWILLGRRAKYEPGTGQHKLWLSAGGSAGQSGLWAVDVDEGTVGEDFGGRVWNVTVTSATEARQAEQSDRAAQKREDKAKRDTADDSAIMVALDRISEGRWVSREQVRTVAQMPREGAMRAFERLRLGRITEESQQRVPGPNKGSRWAACVRRVRDNDQ